MSRMLAVATLSVASSVPAMAEEPALDRYRALTSVAPKRCAPAARDEIVVCAPDFMHSPRLPFPEERGEPGARPRLVYGEVPSFSDRVPCPPRGCPGGGKLLEGLAKVLERIRD